MSGVSKVSICNQALIRVGGAVIASLEENTSREARLCKILYDETLEQILGDYRWTFATKVIPMNLISMSKSPGFQYTYQVPSGCLLVMGVYPFNNMNPYPSSYPAYAVRGDAIDAIWGDAVVKYISKIDDAAELPPYFRSAFVLQLALRLCTSLTDNAKMYNQLYPEAENALMKAKQIDRGLGASEYMDTTNTLSDARSGR